MEGMTQPNPNPPLNDSAREWGKDVNRAIAELQSGQDTNSGNLDTVMYTAEVAIDVANATQENIEQVIIPSIEAPLAVPAPPTGLNLVSARTGWTETGNPIGEATIGWNAVTQDVNSNALRIVGYEVLTGTAGGVLIARNLNPNPSFETGGSTFTVATNLATNPSFETGSGTVVVRRNLSKYQAESGTTTGWGTRGTGVVSLSNVNTQAHSGTRSYQIVCDGTVNAQGLNQLASTGMLVSSGGTQETISLWVKLPLGATVNYIVEEYTTAAAYVGAVGGVALVTGTGDWQRISKTVTKSQAANVVRHVIQTNVAQAITFWADDSLIEAGATLGEFFDGGTPASGDFTYAWSGTANASTSEQRGVGIAGIGHVVGQTLAYQTTDALGHGAKSARWMLTTSGAIGIRAVSDAATPEVGKTYTLLILARAVSRDQSVIPRIGTTLAAPVTLQQGVATEIRVTVTATGASASQTGLLLQSGSGHQPGDLIDIDDALLVEVPSLDQPYTGPYFDGGTPAEPLVQYVWTGTPDASTSKMQTRELIVAPPFSTSVADAPWYDLDVPGPSGDFFGTYALRIESTSDSTREVSVAQGILNGGSIGRMRLATRSIRVQALLFARNSAGLDYGRSWLESATSPGACGQHGTRCGVTDLMFLAQCPPDPADYPPDGAGYDADVDALVRFMHAVEVTSGPFTVEEYKFQNDYVAQMVEFTITSERAFIYGNTRTVELPTSDSTVVQDIPFNLVPYPSAELPGSDVVVAKNLSTNPSVEVNATGWTMVAATVSGTSPATYFTTGRSTDIAAAGTASMRGRILGNGTTEVAASVATVTATQGVALGSQPAGTRFSVTIWGAGLISAGSAVSSVSSVVATLEWLNGSAAVVGTVALGSASGATEIQGRVYSAKSLVPPAGAVTARAKIVYTIGWRSSATAANNSDVRVYADALAVTIP